MARTWDVTVYVFASHDAAGHDDVTKAHAVLATSGGATVDGYGRADDDEARAARSAAAPDDHAVAAAAGALRDLARRLLGEAEDLAGTEPDEPARARRPA